jgi:hypothetical protein
MKPKLLLVLAALAVVALIVANHFLNRGPASRGSLEPEGLTENARATFMVGFLPVT